MDIDIQQELHDSTGGQDDFWSTDQEYFDAYVAAYEAKHKQKPNLALRPVA